MPGPAHGALPAGPRATGSGDRPSSWKGSPLHRAHTQPSPRKAGLLRELRPFICNHRGFYLLLIHFFN